MTEQFDAKAEPMRAIRDLIVRLSDYSIVLGESILSDAAGCEILERAQIGFSRLRKLFGDARLAQDCAHGPMIEPGPSVDFATAVRRLLEIHPVYRRTSIGAPGSIARIGQDEAIAAEDEVRKMLARATATGFVREYDAQAARERMDANA